MHLGAEMINTEFILSQWVLYVQKYFKLYVVLDAISFYPILTLLEN